jgi:tetratricopeptide (TPR) repeat protein
METKEKRSKKATPGMMKHGFSFKKFHLIGIVSLAVFLVYGKSLNFTFTDLDDKIFIINDYELHNDLGDIPKAFTRGVFNVEKTDYYRPVMNIDFTIENILNNKRKSFALYHFTSVLFHVIACVLLLLWLMRLGTSPNLALLLTITFAVHPALMQAVAWIPGRNDTLLACGILAAYLIAERYLQKQKTVDLALLLGFSLLALFTKETAFLLLLLIPFRAFQEFGFSKQFYMLCGLSGFAFVVRIATAKLLAPDLGFGFNEPIVPLVVYRLPVLLQYLGKWFLPVNQSVFPLQDDTALWPGLIGLGLLIAMVWGLQLYKNKVSVLGMGLFVLGMIPLLIIPRLLNEQTYEHRLYLPAAGLLLAIAGGLQQRFSREPKVLYGVMVLTILLALVTYSRMEVFANPRVFWENAAKTSPSSAYAKLMYASRLSEKELKESERLFREAERLNPKEKYINYYMGQVMMKENKVDSADYFYRRELASSAFPGTYFLYAEVKFLMNQKDSAIHFLHLAIEKDPMETKSYNNLILLYAERKDKAKCMEVLDKASKNKVLLSQELRDMVTKMP